jgi:DNA polymerase (family 10)
MMTDRLLKAIANPHVDIIGHPSGRIIGQREPYEVDWPAIFESCSQNHTALEISSFPNRLDLKDSLCKIAKSYGVKFAVSTDAHQLVHLYLMRFGISVARRAWLEKSDIINTKNPAELLGWVKQK